jgi:hypothetical protein
MGGMEYFPGGIQAMATTMTKPRRRDKALLRYAKKLKDVFEAPLRRSFDERASAEHNVCAELYPGVKDLPQALNLSPHEEWVIYTSATTRPRAAAEKLRWIRRGDDEVRAG